MGTPPHCVKKERLVSLVDAVLAIIMTLLVLNLQGPVKLTLSGFWALRNAYFAYTLSFFWLGMLWLSLNQLFAQIHVISNRTMALGLVMLFACSLVPYVTLLASDAFYSQLVQTIFGVCTGAVNLLFIALLHGIDGCGGDPAGLQLYIQAQTRLLVYSLLFKLAGIVVCWTIYPPAVMISIILPALVAWLAGTLHPKKVLLEKFQDQSNHAESIQAESITDPGFERISKIERN